MDQFLVLFITVERYYWHTIIKLETKRMDRVINKKNIFQISVANYSKVFDVMPIMSLVTMLPIQSELNQWSCGINHIDNSISIVLTWSSENPNLIFLCACLQALLNKWSQVYDNWDVIDAHFSVFIHGFHWNPNPTSVWWLNHWWIIGYTMRKGLIQIKQKSFCLLNKKWLG